MPGTVALALGYGRNWSWQLWHQHRCEHQCMRKQRWRGYPKYYSDKVEVSNKQGRKNFRCLLHHTYGVTAKETSTGQTIKCRWSGNCIFWLFHWNKGFQEPSRIGRSFTPPTSATLKEPPGRSKEKENTRNPSIVNKFIRGHDALYSRGHH